MQTLALFPLPLVVFPGAIHTLRIFEPRYLDMVSDCMRNERGFGITLSFEEDAQTVAFAEIGTLVRIIDWGQADNGMLSIRVQGQQKFCVHDYRVGNNDLILAEIEDIPAEKAMTIGPDQHELIEVGQLLQAREVMPAEHDKWQWRDAVWASYRLAELLPLTLEQQQAALALPDATARFQMLSALFSSEELDLEVSKRYD